MINGKTTASLSRRFAIGNDAISSNVTPKERCTTSLITSSTTPRSWVSQRPVVVVVVVMVVVVVVSSGSGNGSGNGGGGGW